MRKKGKHILDISVTARSPHPLPSSLLTPHPLALTSQQHAAPLDGGKRVNLHRDARGD